jgi:hypothetical protein
MIITILNHSKKIKDEELHPVIRAVNRQIREDFEPYWSLGATLRLEGKSTKQPEKIALADMRGDAVLYLWDEADVDEALGYHDANARGIPFGFVFTKVAEQLGEKWTVTLSHEALELVADPLVNLLVAGPHPEEPRTVFHWYEMSDAVQAETYKVDGVEVSNFLLPLYFTPDAEKGSRNDFLGKSHGGKTLASFGINPGGYVGFFDPEANDHVTFANRADEEAKRRLAVKKRAAAGRRSFRVSGGPRERVLAPAAATRRAGASAGGAAAIRTPAAVSGKHYERID